MNHNSKLPLPDSPAIIREGTSHGKHRGTARRKPGLCACKKHWKRDGQGNCYACHARAQAIYRARQGAKLEQANRMKFHSMAERVRAA